jgi:hypothetical protein
MEVRVELIYPKLEFVSDRTFRESLKLASKTIHAIHLSEVQFVLAISNLDPQTKHSVWDQMRGELDHIPNYYIESVKRGSLTIAIALSASAYFFLQKTLGKTIEQAWEKTPLHKWLVGFLSNSTTSTRVSEHPEEIGRNLGSEGARWQWLEREFSARFLNQPRFGRFQVVDFGIQSDRSGDMLVKITFDLADDCAYLEGTFKQLLYADYIAQYAPAARSTTTRKNSKPTKKKTR